MGNARAMAEYGLICRKTKKNKYGEIQPNLNEVLKYIQMASKKGDTLGMLYLSCYVDDGLLGTKENPKEVYKLRKASFEKSDLESYAIYGETITLERYGHLDVAEGLRLIQYAFANGDSSAICCLANFYRFGLHGFEKRR